MVTSKERPQPAAERPERSWWMRPVVAATAIAVVVLAVVAVVVLTGDGGEEEPDPVATVEQFADNLRQGDIEAVLAAAPVEHSIDFFDREFWEWHMAISPEPEFTECAARSGSTNLTFVSCKVTYEEGDFYAQVLGRPTATTFEADVNPEGLLSSISFEAPPGLFQAEEEFRQWILATYPELEDEMFGTDVGGILSISKEAGELHMQYLDEFLTYQASND